MTDQSGKPGNNLEQELTTSDWVNLLTALDDWWFGEGNGGNELLINADEVNIWPEFSANDWLRILLQHPSFAKKHEQDIDWKEFIDLYMGIDRPNGWVQLLSKQPQLSNYCDKVNDWQRFSGYDWKTLLAEQPQFACKCSMCDGWNQFDFELWQALMRRQPQFKDVFVEYVELDKLSTRQCVSLLQDASAFSDIFGNFLGWDKLDGFDWVVLLRERPEFANQCEEFDGWKKIKECGRWSELLSLQPQFAIKCNEVGGWEAFDGFDWWQLLRHEPLFASKCNAYNGWQKIASYRPKWVDNSKSYFDCYGDPYETCTPEKIEHFDYESRNFEFPDDYDYVFSRNSMLKLLLNFGSYVQRDALGNKIKTCGFDFRAEKTYYKTIPTTSSYGKEYGEYSEREIGGLPLDLYDEAFWHYNPFLFQNMDISYWKHIIQQHLRDSLAGDLANDLFSFYDKHCIWNLFSREDWEEILFPTKHTGAMLLNRAAQSSSEDFWDALFAAWPTVIVNANKDTLSEGETAAVFSGWAYLLRYKPQLSSQCDECDGWQHLDSDSWKELFTPKWHFMEKAELKSFGVSFWKGMLKAIPENAHICDKYKGWRLFGVNDWIDLLAERDQFVDQFIANEGWRHFTKYNWRDLWADNYPLAKKLIDYVDFSLFDKNDWLYFIGEYQLFAEKKKKKGLLSSFGWTSKEEVLTEAKRLKRERIEGERIEREWSRQMNRNRTYDPYEDWGPIFRDELGQMHPSEGI